jgi:hypothetical protein
VATSFAAPGRPAAATCRRAIRGQPALFFEIQFDKGLAGAPDEAVAASRDTATNPGVLTAFGLALMGIFGPLVYPGVSGYASDVADARAEAATPQKDDHRGAGT